MAASKLSSREILFYGLFLPVFLLGIGIAVTRTTGISWRPEEEPESRRAPNRAVRRLPDPVTALSALRRARSEAERKSAQDQLLRLGETVVPALRTEIYSASVEPQIRLEAVAVLAEVPGSAAEAQLAAVLRDPSLEEKYRGVALARLVGRNTEVVFEAVRHVFQAEPGFTARHLLVKALGEMPRPACTSILIEASRSEPTASVRIQAVDSLGGKLSEPGVYEVLRERALADPDPQVRRASLASAARSSDPSVRPLLERIAENPDEPPDLRAAARSWLDRITRPR